MLNFLKKQSFKLLSFVACISLCTSCAMIRNTRSQGDVMDAVTKELISGVKIKIDCRKNNFYHGSRSLREIETITDKSGNFKINFDDISDCSWLVTVAEKEGYAFRGRFPDDDGSGLPVRFFLAKNADLNRLKLDDVLRLIHPNVGYQSLNISFLEAIKIAKTDEEIDLVKRHYCERLTKLWTALPVLEKDKNLSTIYVSEIKHTDVVKYCEESLKAG